jgi:hypothetical protein
MKILGTILVIFLFVFYLPAQDIQRRVPGEILVKLKDGRNPFKDTQLLDDFRSKGIVVDNKLGKTFNIWLFKFDENTVNPEKLLRIIKEHPAVQLAQYNHPVTEREVIPNDPDFNIQWAFKNTGQSNGNPGSDIHVTEAWELTTGGVTVLGDTIVVAVIDGGVDLNHSDLNLKKNYNEIPQNGVDDDGNGYIDDFHGWNAYNNTGNLIPHDHGTHVTGIVSASTNNGVGVAGVSYNAKVLPIAGSSTTEATVVASYDYVYTMRKLYNETNGQVGHYIVATNSSFGVDAGNPEEYPLWSAIYDSMGMVGILNVASTANRYWDVDIKGDIPTAMTNESLITVTNTTNSDLLNTQAAWGLTSIDLGAPGTNIYSTKQGNAYGYKTGTSMSSPMVSGTIALMHAITDSARMLEYKSSPSLLVSRFKRYLIATVDTVPALLGKTVSGGRLNTYDAVVMAANPPLLESFPHQINVRLQPNSIDTIALQLSSSTTEINPYSITITPETDWITAESITGIFTSDSNSQTIKLYINSNGLPLGSYECYILADDYFLNLIKIPVTLLVDTSTNTRDISTNVSVKINPNPFDDFLKITINLMRSSSVNAHVYNMQGMMVATIHEGLLPAGLNELVWDGKSNGNQIVGTGVYFIAITDQFGSVTMKAIKSKL